MTAAGAVTSAAHAYAVNTHPGRSLGHGIGRVRWVTGYGVTQNHDRFAIDTKGALMAAQLRATSAIFMHHGNAITHACTPSKRGVVSTVPLSDSSSVVAPILKMILPDSGTVTV